MATRLDLLRKSALVKSNTIDDVFLKNRLFTGSAGDDVMSNPYVKSDLVFICISTTSRAIAQVPLVVGRENQKGDFKPVPYGDPWQKLLFKPNYLLDYYSFMDNIISYLLLDGESFIVPFPPASKVPDSLWVVRKKHMKAIKDSKSGNLLGWEYNPKGAFISSDGGRISPGSYPLAFDEVAHIWFFNPEDPTSGLAPIEAGKMNIVVDYKAATYTSVFFDEGAVPGGMLYTDQKLGDKQFSRVKDQFESRHGGFKKGHRVAVLEQGLKYTQTGLSQRDMEFKVLRDLSAARIYQIFGMKKAVISVTDDVNYATSREERKEWWEGTNIPLTKMVTSAFNFTFFKDEARKVRFDLTVVEALKDALKEKVDTGYRLWQIGFTANEINNRLDLGFQSQPWRDTWYLPINMVPVENDGTPILPEPPKLPEKPEEEEEVTPPPKQRSLPSLQIKDSRNDMIWELFVRTISPYEDQFAKKVSRVFFEMRKRTLELLFQERKTIQDVDEDLFIEELKLLNKLTDPLYAEVLSLGVSMMIDEMGISISFSLSDPEAVYFLSNKTLKIRGIVQTIKNKIHEELIESYQVGETIDQTADRIRSVFEMARSRARTIARTEITGAAQEGRSIAINRSGYREKQWHTAMDEKVRSQHVAMHGKIVKVGQPWVFPDGTSVRHPSDYDGPAHQVINCRCIEIVVPGSHYLLQ